MIYLDSNGVSSVRRLLAKTTANPYCYMQHVKMNNQLIESKLSLLNNTSGLAVLGKSSFGW